MTARELQVATATRLHRPVFRRGEVVRYVGDGFSISSLDTHDKSHDGRCRYVVVDNPGTWVKVACLEHTVGDRALVFRSGYGSSFFRIDGPCGGHRPTYRSDPSRAPGDPDDPTWIGWFCARCEVICPEASSSWHLRPQATPEDAT